MFQLCARRAGIQALRNIRTSSCIIPATHRPFHTDLIRLKKEDLSDVPVVELPKKGKMPVPKEIQELGDRFIALNAIENMILSEYIRDKLGFEDIPNPFSSMLRDAFGDLLIPGTPKHAVPGEAMMLQQQQMMAQMMSQGGGMFMQQQAPQGGAAAEAKPAEEEKAPEKSHYDIKLEKYDDAQKIKLIKELRVIDPSLTVKSAKEIVDGAPSVIKAEVKKDEAEKIKAQLEALGATIALV